MDELQALGGEDGPASHLKGTRLAEYAARMKWRRCSSLVCLACLTAAVVILAVRDAWLHRLGETKLGVYLPVLLTFQLGLWGWLQQKASLLAIYAVLMCCITVWVCSYGLATALLSSAHWRTGLAALSFAPALAVLTAFAFWGWQWYREEDDCGLLDAKACQAWPPAPLPEPPRLRPVVNDREVEPPGPRDGRIILPP